MFNHPTAFESGTVFFFFYGRWTVTPKPPHTVMTKKVFFSASLEAACVTVPRITWPLQCNNDKCCRLSSHGRSLVKFRHEHYQVRLRKTSWFRIQSLHCFSSFTNIPTSCKNITRNIMHLALLHRLRKLTVDFWFHTVLESCTCLICSPSLTASLYSLLASTK